MLFFWEDAQSPMGRSPVSVARFTSEKAYYFMFDFYNEKFIAQCSPWGNQREARFTIGTWAAVSQYVTRWIGYVKNELNTPDPWKALPGYTGVADLRVAPDVVNTQFTFGETEKVARALDDIRRLLLDQARGSREQIALISAELASLTESSKRMGRKDWFNLAIGTVINLAITISMPPDVTRQIFQILRDALSGIVHFLPPIIATGQQLTG